MKRTLTTSLAAISMAMAFGQNYVSGPVNVSGGQWNAATTIASGGTVAVDAGGNWIFGGIVTDRSMGVIAFYSTGTYNSGAAASASGYVDGTADYIGTSNFTYPVGDASASAGGVFHPLTISSLSASVNTAVQYNATTGATSNPGNLDPSVTRVDPNAYWAFSNVGAATATVTAATRDEISTFMSGGQITLAGYGSGLWTNIGTYTSTLTAQNLASAAGKPLSNYTGFTVGSNTFLLPVTLTSFTGLASGCTADLAWQSTTESNSSYYAVEASTDASSFTQVAKVSSKNSLTGGSYSYNYALGSGTGYFRLKAVDFDGKFTYSSVVAVTGTGACGTAPAVKVSPNPTKNMLTIQGLEGGKNRLALYNMNGKKMTEILATGTSQSINVSMYAKGVYVLRIENASGNVSSVKVEKQ